MEELELHVSGRPEPAPAAVQRVDGSTPQPSRLAVVPRTPAWGPPVFVGSVWTLAVLAALVFVLRYGSAIPYMDDWNWVPVLSGEQPVTLSWLWQQVDEHRVPLSKLLLVGLFQLCGKEFRAGLIANVVLSGLLALVMILAARRLRGRTSYLDAFFPLLLLNLGDEIFFLGLGVSVIPSTVLAGIVLVLMVRLGRPPTFGMTFWAGAGVVLLALVGTTGLALVPALVPWLVYLGIQQLWSTRPGAWWKVLVIGALAAGALLLVPLHFIDYKREGVHPPSPGLLGSLWAGLEFFSISFGQAAAHLFWDRPIWPVFGLGIALLSLLSAALLARVCLRQPEERPRAVGLLCFLGAMATLGFGIGLTRAGWGAGGGYAPRYVVMGTPVLCCLYFIWEVYGSPLGRRLAQLSLLVPLLLVAPLSAWETLRYGQEHSRTMAVIEADLRAGTPTDEFARRHRKALNDQYSWRKVASYSRQLRRADIGPFRYLPDDQPAVDEEQEYQLLVERVQEVVGTALPPRATVLVVSKADENLVSLGRRRGWHFPQTADGRAIRHAPAGSQEAIDHLEALRDKGAEYLVFPQPQCWWLEFYKEFKEHLEKHYRLVVRQEDTCIIYDLR